MKVIILASSVWIASDHQFEKLLRDWADGKTVMMDDFGVKIGEALDFTKLKRSEAADILTYTNNFRV